MRSDATNFIVDSPPAGLQSCPLLTALGGVVTVQRKWKWACVAVLALAASACYRTILNVEKTFDLGPGDIHEVIVSPAKSEQKIKVELTASPNPVSVFVFLEKDREAAKHDIETHKKPPAKVLALQENTQSWTQDVTVPPDNSAIVLVTRASKDTKITVKLTN
jgi:hypothetical protein